MLFAFDLPAIIDPPATPPAIVVDARAMPPPMVMLAPARAPARLTDSVRALIDAAIASGDETAVKAILRYARQTNPETAPQIDALSAEFDARQAEKAAQAARVRADQLANAAFLDYWKGEIEIGGSRSTGNTRSLGLYGAVNLNREGLDWRFKFNGRAYVQQTNGVTTTERAAIAFQPNYKVDERFYAYGIAQYEHDRFLGYANRYTGGGGIGYGLIARPGMKLDFEGGPAVRFTDYVDSRQATSIAGRASMNFNWQVTPTLNLSQNAAVYLENDSKNAVATTTLDTRLIGALKARLSYNVQYEADAPPGRDPVDTLSRATLVYSF